MPQQKLTPDVKPKNGDRRITSSTIAPLVLGGDHISKANSLLHTCALRIANHSLNSLRPENCDGVVPTEDGSSDFESFCVGQSCKTYPCPSGFRIWEELKESRAIVHLWVLKCGATSFTLANVITLRGLVLACVCRAYVRRRLSDRTLVTVTDDERRGVLKPDERMTRRFGHFLPTAKLTLVQDIGDRIRPYSNSRIRSEMLRVPLGPQHMNNQRHVDHASLADISVQGLYHYHLIHRKSVRSYENDSNNPNRPTPIKMLEDWDRDCIGSTLVIQYIDQPQLTDHIVCCPVNIDQPNIVGLWAVPPTGERVEKLVVIAKFDMDESTKIAKKSRL